MRGDVPATGFYSTLSLYTHPQSLPEELAIDEADGSLALSTDLEFVAKCSMNALVCWVNGARVLCCDYHGWEVPELDELAGAAAALNPPTVS